MAGNFTHSRYDKDAYDEEIARSTNPLLYRLDPNYAINCNQCFSSNGPRNGHEAATVSAANRIDVDSILKGISKKKSHSIHGQLPHSLDKIQTFMPKNCSFDTEYTRYTHPAYDIKGLNVDDMRLDYPLHDPQCQIFENFQINTRLQAKDNHKTIWQVPLDQRNLLPTEKLNKVKNCTVTVNCNYAPYDR